MPTRAVPRSQNPPPEEPSSQEIAALLQLIGDFNRTKLSLSSLMLRPTWHEALLQELQDAGLNVDDYEGHDRSHWIQLYYRLGRVVEANNTGSINMSCLAEQFGVPLSTATRIADQMVQRGLLERHSDPQDRRVVLLRLSDNGRQAQEIISRAIHERIRFILQHFNPEERQQMLTLGSRLFQMWAVSLREAEQPKAPKGEPNP